MKYHCRRNESGQFLKGHPSRPKLTPEIVVELRNRKAAGESLIFLSREYGVAYETVARLWQRKTWKDVGGADYVPHDWITGRMRKC